MEHFSPKQRTLLKAIRECYAIAPACDRAGVGRTTCYRWMQDTGFAEAVEQAQQDCVDDVESRHVEAAKAKDTISRIHFLKSHRREVYGDHGKIDVEHHDQLALQPEHSPEMLEKALIQVFSLEPMRKLLESVRNSGALAKPIIPVSADKITDADVVQPPKLTEGEQKS